MFQNGIQGFANFRPPVEHGDGNCTSIKCRNFFWTVWMTVSFSKMTLTVNNCITKYIKLQLHHLTVLESSNTNVCFFFFNRHCNPCGLWPAQLSLSILSRKVLQSAVASGTSNSQLGGPVIRTFQLPPPGVLHVWNDARRTPTAEGGNMGEKLSRILPKVATSTSLLGSFTCRKSTTWDRRIYFLSEGRRAVDFFRPKNPAASAGFEPANLGTKGQHATPRPPKPLIIDLCDQ